MKKNIRDFSVVCPEEKLELFDNTGIFVECEFDAVVKTAVYDFIDFLDVSMGISACVTKDKNADIIIKSSDGVDLKEADGYKGFLIETTDDISIYGNDARGVAAANFYLEDISSMEKAPSLTKYVENV